MKTYLEKKTEENDENTLVADIHAGTSVFNPAYYTLTSGPQLPEKKINIIVSLKNLCNIYSLACSKKRLIYLQKALNYTTIVNRPLFS